MKNSSQFRHQKLSLDSQTRSNISDSRPSPVWFSFGNSSRTFSSCPAWKPALTCAKILHFYLWSHRAAAYYPCAGRISTTARHPLYKHDPLIKRVLPQHASRYLNHQPHPGYRRWALEVTSATVLAEKCAVHAHLMICGVSHRTSSMHGR